MTIQEAFEETKKEFISEDLTVKSLDEAVDLHKRFIELRTALSIEKQIMDMMPHYRGEHNFGWDIRSGIFRLPLNINDPETGKDLEERAIREFETTITQKVGGNVFRDIFNQEKHGKDWDLLMQAQHAGIKTTLTDWTPEIISAMYFATEWSSNAETEKSDGQLWCFIVPTQYILSHNNYPTRKTFYDLNPFNLERTILVY